MEFEGNFGHLAPDWLLSAETIDAVVEVTEDGSVIWKDGTWVSGYWRGGTWESGDWYGGTWCDGIWKGGTWESGIWNGGIVCNLAFPSGVWKDHR